MLEANPNLTPQVIKNILASTADRIANQPSLRQGYGVLNASRAVEEAKRERHTHPECEFGPPRIEGDCLVFSFHHDSANSVMLAGDFNEWDATRDHFVKQSNGLRRAEIELPSPGSYQYKFVVDGGVWIDDPGNGMKVADNYNGFNSLLHIAEQIIG